MKRLHKQYVLVAVAIALALTGSGVATVALVAQDRSQQVSEAENEFQDDMDRALWRMETRLAAILARTLSQAPTYSQVEPQPFTGGDLQNDRVAQQDWIAEQSEDIQAAFVDGSPNVSNWVVDLDYGLNVPGPLTPLPVQEALLAGFEQFNPSVIVEQIEADNRGKSLNSTGGRSDKLRGKGRSQVEYGRRAQIVQNNNPLLHEGEKVLANAPAPVPVWHHDDGQTTLFLGRATVFGVEVFQLDWAKLEPELLGQAYDLFPEGRLVPMASSPVVPDETDSLLAGIPARYQTDRPTLIPRLSSQTRVTLVAMWALALLSLGGLVMGLRSAIAYGEQHRRFTSAVTHELRTPLTTFQMYSEMLSLGMVPEDRRAEYLSTLEVESKRLAGLVENALAYARLEEGRRPAALEAISISGLLGQTVPALERLCGASGSTLEVHAPVPGRQLDAGRIVRTDPDAVLQVLTNLVDNACKYAFSSASNVLRLEVIEEPDSLHLAIADEGPGIPVKMQPHVFRPFDRAGRDESDPAPGVGLGLALSRDLARSLGGDLVLEPSRSGARFSLRLPF